MSEKWISNFRTALKSKCGKNWTVYNSRGIVRLQVGKRPNEETLSTAYKWSEDTWIDALNRITTINQIFTESKGKIDLKTAYAISSSASSILELDWPDALNSYRSFKTNVSEKTWKSKHLPVLHIALTLLNKKKKPKNAEELSNLALSKWTKGTTQRRHMRIALNSFLNYVVQRQDFPSKWLPPVMSDDEAVTTTKRIGYPLSDSQILRLVDSVKNPRWKFALQLMATYGLRPNDLKHLHTRNNGNELWSDYRKSQGGKKGLTTQPRQLFPLFVEDIDGSKNNWNLMKKIHIKEELPTINDKGGAGQAVGRFLRDNKVWQQLKKEAEDERQQLTPYSFRHRYAYVGHNRQKDDGTYRAPKQIADAMGHSLDVHLSSYSRFMTKELAKNFDQETVKVS
ncbi:integrase [Prochlorococcus marinus]|uniref:integrase n=1 Tax=Prochlorococcus marinus TaxID=1219 RepID=UPI001FD71545|nr:integrase [Prochlorococcus marinus]